MMKSGAIAVVAVVVGLWALGCGAGKTPVQKVVVPDAGIGDAGVESEDIAVERHAEVLAFILAKCPHAAEVMRSLIALKREMGNAVVLRIGFMGLVDAEGKIDTSIGEPEIAAARVHVCVAQASDDDRWLNYLTCVYGGDKWRSMPDGWEACAKSAKVDQDDVRKCIESGDGDWILAKTYAATTRSKIVSSPTLIIDDYLYAGNWSKERLMQYICYTAGTEETRPDVCRGVTPPPKIAATLLYDQRCVDASMCDVEGEIAVLEKLISGLTLVRIEFSSNDGRALYDSILKTDAGVKELPLVIIDEPPNGGEDLKDLLGGYLKPFGKGYLFALGGGWDPLAEICDNGIDDNADGATDCTDGACKEKLSCRGEIKSRLDLFIMGACPFALEMLPSVDRLLSYFERNRKAIDFHLQFIGKIEGDRLISMHGEDEVAEDLRMICVEDLYGKNYKFMDYMICRAKDPKSPAWERCVPKEMNVKKIRACAEGSRGKVLLTTSFELADKLDVQGSPTWILNNRLPMDGRTLQPMIEDFCKQNKTPGCDKPIPLEPEAQGAASVSSCE